MAKNSLLDEPEDSMGDQYADDMGNVPEVSDKTLAPENRVVSSVDQVLDICNTMEFDAEKLIKNAALITAKKQGSKPFNPKALERQNKAWKTNVNDGTFSTVLRRTAPRLYSSLLNASTLTAAELPQDWPQGPEKSARFREAVTRTIKSWPRWAWFVRGITAEIVDYGYAFGAFTDAYEWRPHLIRMDRGFVPRGTEIMDPEIPFFEIIWDYQPAQLLAVARKAIDAGVEGWHKDAVATALQWAEPQSASTVSPAGWRKWEEMIREGTWNNIYEKGFRTIRTKHLFVLENSGKVSHYIVFPDGQNSDGQLLYERHDAFESMSEVVVPLVFGWGDGTIHGSWGAGHLIYDLSLLENKVACDMVDNLRNSNKVKVQVRDPKDINDVKMVSDDVLTIVSGGEFANNIGGISQNVDNYIALRNLLVQMMDQKVGAYVPPMSMQGRDIKAAQVNAAMQQEQEVAMDSVETYLSQMAHLITAMTKRLFRPDSPDPAAIALRKELLEFMTEEEIEKLVNQPVVRSVVEFTPLAAASRAAFAAQNKGDPRFYQARLARVEAEGVPSGGARFADYVVIPDGDQTEQEAARRQQLLENTALLLGSTVPVLVNDNHWVHMQTMKEPMTEAINGGLVQAAEVALLHYTAHYTAGVAQKTIPDAAINAEKSFIAQAEKAILQAKESQQQAQMAQLGAQAPVGAPMPMASGAGWGAPPAPVVDFAEEGIAEAPLPGGGEVVDTVDVAGRAAPLAMT